MGWGLLWIASLTLLLVSAGVEDLRRREIANWKNVMIAALAPLWWWSNGLSLWPDIVLQVTIAGAFFALFCIAFHFGQMGGGDVKMIGALGLWLPFTALVGMLLIMSIVGGVLTIIFLLERRIRRKTEAVEVPYGVAIAVAGLLVLREPLFNQFT